MTQPRTRGGRYAVGAACSALALTTVLTSCGQPAPEREVGRVERGELAIAVKASGALSSVESQNVGFRTGAQLKELSAKVGDRVEPGQFLARIDDFRIKNARDITRTSVQSAQANLDRVVKGVTVENARKALDQAERSFDKTVGSVNAQIKAAERNLERAEARFVRDIDALEDALNRGGTPASCRERYGPDKLKSEDRYALEPTFNQGPPQLAPEPEAVPLPPTVPGMNRLTNAMSNTCNPTSNAGVVSAFNTAFASKSAIVTAKNSLDTTRKAGKVTIEGSRTSKVAAENALRAAEVDRPITITQLQALLDSAAASLRNAEQDLKDTVLFAPVGGTVAAINGVIGEYVGGGSGVSSQSPGVASPIPGVGAAASSDQAGAAASGISATRPGGAAFIVLNNLNTFQAIVPFEESDAAKVSPGMKVDVTFDSIPGLRKEGTVQTKAPSGVNISGVTNYYVTVLLDSGDDRLTTGQTAQVGVITDRKGNVLKVPTAAVTKRDGKSFVDVRGPDGNPTPKAFQSGIESGGETEVLGGLNEGDEVLLPAPDAGVSGG